MDDVTLALRVAFSLAVVLGIVWVISRAMRGRSAQVQSVPLQVLSRTPVGKHSSIAVISAGQRGLIVGITQHSVQLLGDIDLPQAPAARAEVRTPIELSGHPDADILAALAGNHAAQAAGAASSALAGSLLSPGTWRQAVTAVRERTVRS